MTALVGQVLGSLPASVRRLVQAELQADLRDRFGLWEPGDIGFQPDAPSVGLGERTGPPGFHRPRTGPVRCPVVDVTDRRSSRRPPTPSVDGAAHLFDRYCTEGFGEGEIARFHAFFPPSAGVHRRSLVRRRTLVPRGSHRSWPGRHRGRRSSSWCGIRSPWCWNILATTIGTRRSAAGWELADAVDRGYFGAQLERLYDLVPADLVQVVQFEYFVPDAPGALVRTWEFLGLGGSDRPISSRPVTTGPGIPGASVDAAIRSRLQALYADDVARLARADVGPSIWPVGRISHRSTDVRLAVGRPSNVPPTAVDWPGAGTAWRLLCPGGTDGGGGDGRRRSTACRRASRASAARRADLRSSPSRATGVSSAGTGIATTGSGACSTSPAWRRPRARRSGRSPASGYGSNAFDDVRREDESFAEVYFHDLDLDSLKGKIGLDAGCGKGRYTRFLAEHLDAEVALDGSSAVEAAARNLADIAGTAVVRVRPPRCPIRPRELRLHLQPGGAPPSRRPVRRVRTAPDLPGAGRSDPALSLQSARHRQCSVDRPQRLARPAQDHDPDVPSPPEVVVHSHRGRPVVDVRSSRGSGLTAAGSAYSPTCRCTATAASPSAAWCWIPSIA